MGTIDKIHYKLAFIDANNAASFGHFHKVSEFGGRNSGQRLVIVSGDSIAAIRVVAHVVGVLKSENTNRT